MGIFSSNTTYYATRTRSLIPNEAIPFLVINPRVSTKSLDIIVHSLTRFSLKPNGHDTCQIYGEYVSKRIRTERPLPLTYKNYDVIILIDPCLVPYLSLSPTHLLATIMKRYSSKHTFYQYFDTSYIFGAQGVDLSDLPNTH